MNSRKERGETELKKGVVLKGIIAAGFVVSTLTFTSPFTARSSQSFDRVNLNKIAERCRIGRIVTLADETDSSEFSVRALEKARF